MSIQKTINEIEDLFSIFDDPKEKFAQLMDIAKEYEGIPEKDRTEKNKNIWLCFSGMGHR